MIDWLAHETPQDFGFKLDCGVFTCECPQWRGQARADGEVDPAYLDLIAAVGRAQRRDGSATRCWRRSGCSRARTGPSAAAHAGVAGAASTAGSSAPC